MGNIYEDVFGDVWQPVINLGDILKIPLVIVLVGILLYSFMLLLRVRILIDTVASQGNHKMKVLVTVNLIYTILAAVLGTMIIISG